VSTIRHAHSSSLYSKGPLSLAAQVERAVTARNPNATLLTFTEVGSPERERVLYDADPENWAAWVPEPSDVGMMWRRAQWRPRWKEPHKLTDKEWTDGQGRKHETWAASALLDHTDGHSLFVSVCHLPSNVQNGDRFNDNAQARAWKSAVNGWHDYWTKVRKKDKPDLGMIVADWNIDFHRSDWRQYVQGIFPSMALGWSGNMPPKGQGTHGSRLIDATWATQQASKCVLLKDDASSDHRPYGEAITWGS
jgi:hypothetical protein